MTDVFIRATLEGFDEGKLQLASYQNGLKQLQTQINQVQGNLGGAVSKGDFVAAQEYSRALAGLNTQYKDLEVNLSRITPDMKGFTIQQKEMLVSSGATAEGMEKIGAAGRHLGLGSAYARRELLILGREVMEGNFSRIPGTLITLAAHTGVFSSAMIAVAVPVLGAAAAVGAFIAAAVSGTKELNAMNNALIMTGNFAGMTQEHMASLSRTISNAGTLTVGTSRDIVTQIVASGKYSAENVGKLASLVDSYAAAIGKSVKEVTPALIKMFEDPAKAAAAFGQQLSVAELEHIRTLQSTGKAQEAVSYALDLFIERIPKAVDNIGLLEKAYIATKKALSDMLGEMKDSALSVGTAGLDKALSDTRRNIAELEARQQFTGSKVGEKELVVAKALLAELLKQEAARAAVAVLVSEETQKRKDQVKAQEEINKSTLGRISSLEKERDFIIANGVASVEKDRRVLELNKEIRDLQRSMGAEAKALTDARIAGAEKLRDIQVKGAIAQIDFELKLGIVSQEEANRKKGIIELEKNYQTQLDTQQKLKSTLSPASKQELQDKLQQLQAEFQIKAAQMGQTDQLLIHNKIMQENKLMNELALSQMKEQQALQDKQINQVVAYDESVKRMLDDEKFKLSLVGKTTEQQTLLTALHKLDLDYQKAILNVSDEIKEAATKHYEEDKAALTVLVQANADASKEVNQFWKTAAKDMQRSMSSFFFDIMQGNVTDLMGSFKKMIDKMVADTLAAKAMLALVGPDWSRPGNTAPMGGLIGQGIGWLGGMFGFGGGGSTAGMAAAAGNSGAMEGALLGAFAGGGSFTVGGRGGTDSQTVGFKATPGEKVTIQTPAQQQASGNQISSPSVNVGGSRVNLGGARIVVNNVFNVSGNTDRRSQAQIAAAAGIGMQRALARNT